MTATESLDLPPVALITFNRDTGRTLRHGTVDPVRLPRVAEMAKAYMDLAVGMIDDASHSVFLAYDPALLPGSGSCARYIALADRQPSLAEAVVGELGPDDHSAVIVVFGPSFVEWQTTPEMLAESVADDLTAAIQIEFPIKCTGPITKLMPFLFQIAGGVLIPEHDPAEPASIDARKDRAVGRAINAIASEQYDGINAIGQLVTDNPAWVQLSSVVAENAADIAPALRRPMSRKSAVNMIHQSISQALKSSGLAKVKPLGQAA